jgi:hypothetical protein
MMKREAQEVSKLTMILLGWSTRLIANGVLSTLADSGDVPQKGTTKLSSLGFSSSITISQMT